MAMPLFCLCDEWNTFPYGNSSRPPECRPASGQVQGVAGNDGIMGVMPFPGQDDEGVDPRAAIGGRPPGPEVFVTWRPRSLRPRAFRFPGTQIAAAVLRQERVRNRQFARWPPRRAGAPWYRHR